MKYMINIHHNEGGTEIKTPLFELEQEEMYVANKGDTVIADIHSLNDVLRWLSMDTVDGYENLISSCNCLKGKVIEKC